MIEIAREHSGAAMIALPSSVADFSNPEAAHDIERYIHSPGVSAQERVRLLKMAWDLIGSEFAGRHQQYEKFYGGASFLIKQNMYRNFDFARAERLVNAALALANTETAYTSAHRPPIFGPAAPSPGITWIPRSHTMRRGCRTCSVERRFCPYRHRERHAQRAARQPTPRNFVTQQSCFSMSAAPQAPAPRR